MPEIADPAELRVTLYVIYALARRPGYPRGSKSEPHLQLQPAIIGGLRKRSPAACDLIRLTEQRRSDVADDRPRIHVVQQITRGNRNGR